MPSRHFFTAQAGFDAARQLHKLPTGHRALRLHGHGFQAHVRAALDGDSLTFPGGELSRLQTALNAVVAPLDHVLLNEHVDEPSDDGLARWISDGLGLPQPLAVGVQSSVHCGVDLDAGGTACAWRRYRFQSAHRLPHVPLGHKCGRMHGHGFEAVVHLRLAPGESSPQTIDRLDDLWAPLHHELNYACLNDLAGLENPTSEMLSRWLWNRLAAGTDALVSVKVYETASCGAHYDGAVHRIWKDFHLDSALRLRNAPVGHPLAGLHGHTYTLRLHLSAELDQVQGWAMDFGDVKELFKPVFKALDHHPLHDIPDLADCDSASLARWILVQARARLPQVSRVDLFETEGCGAIVCADDAEPVLTA